MESAKERCSAEQHFPIAQAPLDVSAFCVVSGGADESGRREKSQLEYPPLLLRRHGPAKPTPEAAPLPHEDRWLNCKKVIMDEVAVLPAL